MTACRVCATPLRDLVLDLGPQPVTKNLLRSATAPDPTHGLALTQCPRCKKFADKYVEHDFVVLFIDLVLIKPQVRIPTTRGEGLGGQADG